MLTYTAGTGLAFVFPCLVDDLSAVAEELELESPEKNGSRGPFAQAFALFNCGIAGGTVLGPLWMGFAVPSLGWPSATLILGILALLACVPVLLFLAGHGSAVVKNEDASEEITGRAD